MLVSRAGVDPTKKSMRSKHKHSFWPIAAVPYNLPPWLRTHPAAVYLCTVVPHKAHRLQPSFAPLIDELLYCYQVQLSLQLLCCLRAPMLFASDAR